MKRVTITVEFTDKDEYEELINLVKYSYPVIGQEFIRRRKNSTIKATSEYVKPFTERIEIINGLPCEVYKSKI